MTGSPQLQLSEGSPVLDQQNPDLKHILQKIDNHIFCGTKKAYEVFKQFDVDKDGKRSLSPCPHFTWRQPCGAQCSQSFLLVRAAPKSAKSPV